MNWFSKMKKNDQVVQGTIPEMNPQIPEVNEIEDDFAEELATSVVKTIKQDVKRRTPIFQPNAFQTIRPVADELIQQKIILIDLSKLSESDRLRTIDFLSGVMYGLNGEYKKMDHKIYKFIVRK